MPLDRELYSQKASTSVPVTPSEQMEAWRAEVDSFGAYPRPQEALLLISSCPDPCAPEIEDLQRIALSQE